MSPQLGKLGWTSDLSPMFGSWPRPRTVKPCLVSQFPAPLPLSASCFSSSNVLASFCAHAPRLGPAPPSHRVGLPAHPRGLPTPSPHHLSFYDLCFPAPPLTPWFSKRGPGEQQHRPPWELVRDADFVPREGETLGRGQNRSFDKPTGDADVARTGDVVSSASSRGFRSVLSKTQAESSHSQQR